MKKVLFTATVDSHILQFHIPYLKLFKEKGYEVHVATNGTANIPYCDVKHVVSFERSPIKINNLKAIKQLKKIINKEKFEIIHCHTPMGSVVTRLAAKKARKEGTKVIYTAHGFHFYKGAPLINWMIFYPIEKYLSKYTDCLITINEEDYTLARKKFKKCKQIELVYGVGVDENKFDFEMTEQEKHELRKSLGLKDDDFVLIQVGELNKNKNQIMAIDAMKELIKENNNIHLLLVGEGVLEQYYKGKIQKYKLENNIHILGYRTDVPKLMKISNTLLSLSYREGLPVNVIEGMICGLPIIATDCRGNRDLVTNGENGYVVQKKYINELIDKTIELYNNKELCEKMHRSNFKNIKKYCLDNVLKDMDKIYFKKKKILHILSSNKYSGAENVVCTIIDKIGNEYDMYYCSPNGPIREFLKEKGINYVPIKKFTYKEIKQTVNSIKPDIIHAHDNKATVYASLLYKKCKIISHIHGNNKIMNTFNLKTLLFNICSRKIEKFIWVSDSSFNGYYFNKKIKYKSAILYNVIDQTEIIKKSKLYEPVEKYDICFLGRLSYPKNVLRLIDIIKNIKSQKTNIKIAIIGEGEDREIIERKIEEYKLNDNIKMYGYLMNPYPILNNSQMLVMTSIYEGTPICALEAQALNKPIIATKVDGLIKIVKNGYNGYLSNSNKKLENKIFELLSNKKIYTKYVEHTKRMFTETNNINKYLMKIKEIYNT